MVNRWPLWTQMTGAAAVGAVTAFGLAPYGLWYLALAGWTILPVLVLIAPTRARAAALGWAYAAGYFAHALIWLVEPFLVDIQRHGWMAPFALAMMSSGLALFWAAAFWAAHRLGRSSLQRALLVVPCLALAEFGRAYLFTGFPWAAPAQGLVDSPMLALLAWLGPHGLALLVLAASAGLGLWIFHRRLLWFLTPTLLLAGLTLAAQVTRPEVEITPYEVRVIQPNAVQHQKWDPDWIPIYFQRQLDLTAEGPRPDLIVWPESAIAPVFENAGPWFEAIAQAAAGSPVALGIRRYDGGRFFNALALLDAAGQPTAVYDKHHLVPFGEYIPLGGLAKRFGIQGLAAEDGDGYSAGPGPQVMDFGPLGLGLPLICYEAVFPQDVNRATDRPSFLLQVTNDAWFGERVGPYQHLAQARMRAVEHGLPMIRSANTGVSAIISPHGEIRDSLALGTSGYVQTALPAALPPTVYARTGDLLWLVVTLIALGGALYARPGNPDPLSD